MTAAGRSRRGELVDVECRLVAGRDTLLAWVVTDGSMTADQETGRERLKWFWLPKSMVELTEPDRDGDVTATMPRWLAEEKGLV